MIRFLSHILVVLACLWLGGFLFFLGRLDAYGAASARGDAAVVLTGGPGRIEAAGELLRARRVTRVLISGVHPDVRPAELAETSKLEESLFDCCIDLGRGAMDTLGNAREAADWATDGGYGSLVIVTASDHLPRAMLVFDDAMPDLALSAVAVAPPRNPFSLAREYSKYLLTLIATRIGL